MTAIAAILVTLLVLLLIGFAKHPPRWLVARETKYWRAFFAHLGAPLGGNTDPGFPTHKPRVVPNGGDSGHSPQHVASFEAALDRIYQASLSTPAKKGFDKKPQSLAEEFAVNAAPRRI